MLRLCLLLLLFIAVLVASPVAMAQEDVPPSPTGGAPAQLDPGQFPTPEVIEHTPVIEGVGAVIEVPPSPPVPDAPALPREAPPPVPEDLPAGRIRIHSTRQLFNAQEGVYHFFGSAMLQTSEITIGADEATYTDLTRTVIARGNVSIRAEDGNVYWGNVLEYNLRTRDWRFLDWTAELPPAFLGAPFIAPVYVEGNDLSGVPGKLTAKDTQVTTCDCAEPHYELRCQQVEIFPGDKLIARNCDLYILGKRVVRLPWFFLSLRQQRTPFVPEVGHNDIEGYYMRTLYQYVVNDNNVGGVRVDLTEKRGTGVGVDHFYTLRNGYGEVFVYGRQDLSEYFLRLDHNQQLPKDITLDLGTNFRKRSLLTASGALTGNETNETGISLRMLRPTRHGATNTNTLLTFRRNLSENRQVGASSLSTFYSDTTGANLRYDLTTPTTNIRYSGEYNSFPSGSNRNAPANQELWNRLQAAEKTDFGLLNMRIDQRMDPDGDAVDERASYGVQRIPEFIWETNQDNLLRGSFFHTLPTSMAVGWGIYDEQRRGSTPPERQQLNRYLLNLRSQPNPPIKLGGTTLSPLIEYRQTVYGDEKVSAYYFLRGELTLRSAFNPALSNVVTYKRQTVDGFSPFEFDRVQPNHTITEGLSYVTKPVQAFLNVGRDIQNDRWQNMTLRGDAWLNKNLRLRESLYYDLNRGRWGDLSSQVTWEDSPHLLVDLSSRYDMENGQLKNVSSQLAWVINPVWRLQWLSGYDGISNRFSYNQVLITRDLHCWDASLSYSDQDNYIYLYFRLKALNLPLPLFGVGSSGQVLVPSVTTPF